LGGVTPSLSLGLAAVVPAIAHCAPSVCLRMKNGAPANLMMRRVRRARRLSSCWWPSSPPRSHRRAPSSSSSRSPTGTSAIWALKAKILLHEPASSSSYFSDLSRAYSHLDYPLLWPLAIAWAWTAVGEADLTAVKVLAPALLLAFAA